MNKETSVRKELDFSRNRESNLSTCHTNPPQSSNTKTKDSPSQILHNGEHQFEDEKVGEGGDEADRNDEKAGEDIDEAGRRNPCNPGSVCRALNPPDTLTGISTDRMESALIPPCMSRPSSQFNDALRTAIQKPPCTITTLRELDLISIQNNLNLRIDICYDHDLYFQPVSGRKGDAKKTEADKYWLSLVAEFRIYEHNARSGCMLCGGSSARSNQNFVPRLPMLFENLREIVQMLVPDLEHEEVKNHLDVSWLMQQVREGVLDIIGLSEWLTNLLTSHCAPMRDSVASEISTNIRAGVWQSDIQFIVDGIEKLFGLLEAMKLDIANHQIRAFRYPLIEDTVPFQRDCFSKAIEARHLDIAKSREWYCRARNAHRSSCSSSSHHNHSHPFDDLIHGMVALCDPRVDKVPTTFQYDHHRFVRLQEDLQDLIQVDICLGVFERCVHRIMGSKDAALSKHEDLKSRIIYLTEDDEGNGGAISDHLDAIGLEIARAVYATCNRMSQPCPQITEHDSSYIISRLKQAFKDEEETQNVTKGFILSLELQTKIYAHRFLPMSTLEVSNAQRQWQKTRAILKGNKESLLADWDDMARRLAHIATLHWKVWADMCYLQEGHNDLMEDTLNSGDTHFRRDDERQITPSSGHFSSLFDSSADSRQSCIDSAEDI